MARIVLRYRGRDIIRVNQSGERQGFYRSTGRNSGKPNEWLPFNGITCPAWFDKHEFCHPLLESQGLMRYGTEENKLISQKLNNQYIPQGREASEIEINEFLGQQKYAQDWKNYGEKPKQNEVESCKIK